MDTSNLTLTVLGCGNMGMSILSGLLSSQYNTSPQSNNKPNFKHFIACVNRPESIPKVKDALSKIPHNENQEIYVWQGRNLEAIQKADVVLLSCQASHAIDMFSDPATAKAFSNKILLNICIGLTVSRISTLLQENSGLGNSLNCTIIHAMPNLASKIRQSSTIIKSYPTSSPHTSEIINHIFSSIGTTITVPDTQMSAASVTAASTTAFFALALEGVIEGAVAEGVSREDARVMAAQAMKGAAGLVLVGREPGEVVEMVMTKGGCTEKGVAVLREGRVGERFAEAVRVAVGKAGKMLGEE